MGLSDTGNGATYGLQRASHHRDEDSREITTLTSRLRHAKSESRKWRKKYEEERSLRLALVKQIEEQGLDDFLLNR